VTQGIVTAEFAGNSGMANYLHDIGQHDLLKPEEELELARQLAKGRSAERTLDRGDELSEARRCVLQRQVLQGRQARQRLIESNLRLVVAIARQYVGRGLSLADLIQEGNIGLQNGIERYDWRKGFRLSTYVYWWIRQAMTRALANDSRLIRLPVHAGELLRQAAQAEQQLAVEFGREPTVAELAKRLTVDPERLRSIRQVAARPASLDVPLRPGESSLTRGELLPDDRAQAAVQSAAEADDLSEDVAAAVATLAPREREVLELRFGLGQPDTCTLAQVGARLGFTRERARQIESQALRKLRANVRLRRALMEVDGATGLQTPPHCCGDPEPPMTVRLFRAGRSR
jgi:RNA polymerase primary sigma factor